MPLSRLTPGFLLHVIQFFNHMNVNRVDSSKIKSNSKSSLGTAITTTAAVLGGTALAAGIGGIGIVGGGIALGLGATELFVIGATGAGLAAHKAQKSLAKKPEPKKAAASKPEPSTGFKSTADIAREINDMRNGVF